MPQKQNNQADGTNQAKPNSAAEANIPQPTAKRGASPVSAEKEEENSTKKPKLQAET